MVYKNNIGLYQYQLERLSIEKKKEKEKKDVYNFWIHVHRQDKVFWIVNFEINLLPFETMHGFWFDFLLGMTLYITNYNFCI